METRFGFVVLTGRHKILDYQKPDGQQIATADNEEAARTIVRALNANDASVEALKGVAIMLNTQLASYESEPWALRVRAALALANKESE